MIFVTFEPFLVGEMPFTNLLCNQRRERIKDTVVRTHNAMQMGGPLFLEKMLL